MSHRQTSRESFDTEINSFTVSVEFTRTTAWGYENYGADADGNRGMMILQVDEDQPSDIKASWEDETTGNAHNNVPYDELPKAFQLAVINAIDTWFDLHEPVSEGEPERDYDDEPADHEHWWDD